MRPMYFSHKHSKEFTLMFGFGIRGMQGKKEDIRSEKTNIIEKVERQKGLEQKIKDFGEAFKSLAQSIVVPKVIGNVLCSRVCNAESRWREYISSNKADEQEK